MERPGKQMELIDGVRMVLAIIAGWCVLSIVIAAVWGTAGYRLNGRRELATQSLLDARKSAEPPSEVSVPGQVRTEAVPTVHGVSAPVVPAASKGRRAHAL